MASVRAAGRSRVRLAACTARDTSAGGSNRGAEPGQQTRDPSDPATPSGRAAGAADRRRERAPASGVGAEDPGDPPAVDSGMMTRAEAERAVLAIDCGGL